MKATKTFFFFRNFINFLLRRYRETILTTERAAAAATASSSRYYPIDGRNVVAGNHKSMYIYIRNVRVYFTILKKKKRRNQREKTNIRRYT